MSAVTKVIIATEWYFSSPSEIRDQFRETRIGSDKDVTYDQSSHYFSVDCPIFESKTVSEELTKIICAYIDEHEMAYEDSDDLGEILKIRPIAEDGTQMTEQDHIWATVSQIEAQALDDAHGQQLIPQVTKFKDGAFLPKDMHSAFSKLVLSEIAQATNCQVELEITQQGAKLTNRLRVVGWSGQEVERAMALLKTAEEQYEATMQDSAFDFFDDDGWPDPRMQLRQPQTNVDVDVFAPGQPPVYELIMVEWLPTSRQNRAIRKAQTSVDGSVLERTLWLQPPYFEFEHKKNDPRNWPINRNTSARGEMSLPELGRLTRWVDDVAGIKPDSSVPEGQDEKPAVRPRKAIRVPPPPKANQAKTKLAFDEKVKDDSSDDSSDFEPLQGPTSTKGPLAGQQASFVLIAVKSGMAKAKRLHQRGMAFEMCFGRAYIHAVSVRSTKIKPPAHSREPGTAFGFGDWPKLFRIRPMDRGASIQFSRQLTQDTIDAEFLLQLKMKGGEPLFETKARDKRAYFQVICRDSHNQADAVIEISTKDAGITIEGTDETAAAINFHYPCHTWDASWRLHARKQNFPPEQQHVFESITNRAFVSNTPEDDPRDPELYSKLHDRLSIRSIKLIRETVHRAPGQLALVLSQIKVLEVQTMGEGYFKAYALDDEALEAQHKVWWEAKLVSSSMQRMLEENRNLKIGGVATWEIGEAEAVLREMLEVAQHVVTKIDNVGYVPTEESADGQSAVQSQSRSLGQTASQSQAQEAFPLPLVDIDE